MRNPFRLTRWFAVLGFVTIALVSVVSSYLLSRFMVSNVLHRDASVSMEFVQSIAEVQQARNYFTGQRAADTNLVEFFNHISTMPSVLRANVFGADRTIIWSSDPSMIGRQFEPNPELDQALRGRLQIVLDKADWKPEHMLLDLREEIVVENYLPVRSGNEVIGVVELYKSPRTLFASVRDGLQLIWLSGLGGGLFVYGVLFWVVLRADRTIQAQQQRLVQNETLAALGAMASAVAHGIRNPLASIRSCAELHLDDPSERVRESSEDIVHDVDRLERWVRDLLAYSVPESGEPENVRIAEVLHDSLNGFASEFEKRSIRVRADGVADAPPVRGDSALLTQVFNSLLTNAVEAMPHGGLIELTTSLLRGPRKLRISVSDNGTGVAPEYMAEAFVPRKSTKRTGLGLGLPLAKRIVEQFGGDIELVPRGTGGATVNVDLVIAS